jgi:hypothetical protein
LVGLGYLEGILMISETTVMMLIAIQFGFMAFVLMKLDMKKGESERLKNEIENTVASINVPQIDIEEIKGEMIELIEDLMSQIRIPTILDHVGGIASMFMQQKMAALQQVIPDSFEEVQDHFTDEEF